jgi:hypothetical protein
MRRVDLEVQGSKSSYNPLQTDFYFPYDNYMAGVFPGNFTLHGVLMHYLSMVERELICSNTDTFFLHTARSSIR